MLDGESQARVKKILDAAKKALESGNLSECTEALERIAEAGALLSDVILYDPSTLSADAPASDDGEADGGEA
jgi:hypothetical protein